MCYSLKKTNYCHFHVSQQQHHHPLIQLQCLPVLCATALLDMTQIWCILKMDIIQVNVFCLQAWLIKMITYGQKQWVNLASPWSQCLQLLCLPLNFHYALWATSLPCLKRQTSIPSGPRLDWGRRALDLFLALVKSFKFKTFCEYIFSNYID